MLTYTVVVAPDEDEGGYVVTVPLLPGCVTQGETIEEAVERAREAVEGHIQALVALGDPVPVEVDHPTLATISASSPPDVVTIEA